MLTNIIVLVIAHILTLWAFRAWLNSDQFDKVAYSPKLMRTIALRTALLYILLGAVCWLFAENALILLLMIVAASLLLLSFGVFAAYDLAESVIGFYSFLFRWILGFPPEELWISPMKEYKHPDTQPAHLIGKSGFTQSPLRPVGNVCIDNQKYEAVSDSGFIEKDTPVSVIAVKNNTLIVRIDPIKNPVNPVNPV